MRVAGTLAALIAAVVMLAAGPRLPQGGSRAIAVSFEPDKIGKPPFQDWPTFNGDYSGARFSSLTQIESGNVSRLARQWVFKVSGVGAQRGAPVPVIKCTPLLVAGV